MTQAQKSRSRPEPAQLPKGDVIRILLEQHARINELFGRVRNASGKSKQQLFEELRRLLTAHEAAEEMIVRPVTRAASGGSRTASARNAEEGKATQMLANLERLGPSSPGFSAELAELETNVVEHAQHEETEEFPLIITTRSEQQRAWMGMAVRAVETLAPTHPHVTAAGSTIAQYVLGPMVSLLDHGRDAAKKVLAR
jgi:iron-sulfur cluster repair protein YtfE (RIC family)